MRVRYQLASIVLIATACAGALGTISADQKRARLRTLRAQAFRRASLSNLDVAYLNAFTLLDQRGACRDFFGGSGAEEVLDALVVELREERIHDSNIGIRMLGRFTIFSENNFSYRLFEAAELNNQGPFCKAKVFAADPFVPNVGSFRPNTRQARVLILLHELAHLIQRKDGQWLIPDDGDNSVLSRRNTATVESHCGKQIRAL